jgi:arylsulfatase A-like enzyme
MRHTFAFAVAALMPAIAATGEGAPIGPAPARPNVLLIVMDTVRADHLSSYGYPKRTAPNLERLASEGVLFEQAISAGSWTLPSHATLFTGLYARDHLTTAANWKLDAGFETLAEVLGAAGYRTAGFSNNPWISDAFGLTQGFATFLDMWRDSSRRRDGDDGAARTNELVLDWLDSAGRDRPFFVFVNFMEPHLPYAPPEAFARRFVPGGTPPDLLAELRGWKHPRELGYVLRVPGYGVTPEQFRILGALYDAEIACLDSKIDDLVRGLEARGLLDDTLLIVTADHGEHLGDHELMDHKMSVYDALIHVPLILRYPPRVPQGVRIRGLVQTNDVFPTVLGLCGVARKAPRGAFPLPLREADTVRDRAVTEFGPPTEFLRIANGQFPGSSLSRFDRSLVAIRESRYKYIWSSDGRSELYDLVSDPGEDHDLAAEREGVRQRLHERLVTFREDASGGPSPHE